MPEIYLVRSANVKGTAAPHRAPIYVDSDDNTVKVIPAGSGSTEKSLAYTDGAQALKSSSPSLGIGYSTGAGAAVTQITNRTTGVVATGMSGQITTDPTSLGAELAAEFTVTDTSVAIGDVVAVSIQSGSNGGNTAVTVTTVAAGSFKLKVSNNNAAGGTAETGAIIINFVVIKGVSN